ncbi:MAG: hypothetical protein MI976_14120 [Pseudomonadales bacterium]|nr:hypothetical protein [Pseudomonadales bacterium]
MTNLLRTSELICPECGYKETLTMPLDACQWFHECSGCQSLLSPKPGDCCVFCSFGSIPCPPIQLQGKGESLSKGCCGE